MRPLSRVALQQLPVAILAIRAVGGSQVFFERDRSRDSHAPNIPHKGLHVATRNGAEGVTADRPQKAMVCPTGPLPPNRIHGPRRRHELGRVNLMANPLPSNIL